MKIFQLAFISTGLLISSCVTPSQKPKKESVTSETASAESSQVSGQVIVMQSLATTPVVSGRSRDYWVNLRANNTESLSRMRGLLATGEWQKAIESARSYLKKHPNDPEAMMGLASANAIGRKYEMAGYYASQVLKVQPSNSDAMNLIGLRIMMATGNRRADYQDAITWFQKSIDSDGTQVAAGLNLGHLYMELGNSPSAVEPFRLASQRCQLCERAQMGLGIASSRAGRGEDALAAFEQVLSKNSENAEAKYQMAMVYKNNFRDESKAQKVLQELVSDADGRFKEGLPAKRQANIALRRLKANDRSGEDLKYATQNVRSHSKEKEREIIPVSDKAIDEE